MKSVHILPWRPGRPLEPFQMTDSCPHWFPLMCVRHPGRLLLILFLLSPYKLGFLSPVLWMRQWKLREFSSVPMVPRVMWVCTHGSVCKVPSLPSAGGEGPCCFFVSAPLLVQHLRSWIFRYGMKILIICCRHDMSESPLRSWNKALIVLKWWNFTMIYFKNVNQRRFCVFPTRIF